jgi:hypothetical protein
MLFTSCCVYVLNCVLQMTSAGVKLNLNTYIAAMRTCSGTGNTTQVLLWHLSNITAHIEHIALFCHVI